MSSAYILELELHILGCAYASVASDDQEETNAKEVMEFLAVLPEQTSCETARCRFVAVLREAIRIIEEAAVDR